MEVLQIDRNNRERSALSFQLEKIARYLEQLRLKKKLFGVDEADVWKKIEKLNEMYEDAVLAERERYNILLEERTRALSENAEDHFPGNEGSISKN